MMFDPRLWFPGSDVDERALAIGESSRVDFVLSISDMFAPTLFMYRNSDSVAHEVVLEVQVPGGSVVTFYQISILAGSQRLLYPGRLLASAGGPVVESRNVFVFSGPLNLRFRNLTAAVTAHTPRFDSLWLQAKALVVGKLVPITRVIV